ncbi:MAG: glycosyltransferase [Sterolibacteriaceae bacterium]|nr:glycosyltransferase [Candidatus Methylophosphatis haderslevensis]
MDYPPNNTAMLHFIEETFPIIRKENPNVTLTIAGRNPTDELVSLAARSAGVKVTGFVEDLRTYFQAATVYVSPLLSGAGLKNKVLEAWSMMLPVVASSVSCSGMAAADNRNLLIADSPSEFASKVLALLSDSDLRERLSKEGRATVEREYSWQCRGAMLGSIFAKIVNEEHVSPGIHLSA